MKNEKWEKISPFILLLAVFMLTGFSNNTLKDVETAIIGRNYKEARNIATQLLSSRLVDGQQNEIKYYIGLCDLRLGDYAKARTIFSELIKIGVDHQLRDKAYLGLFDGYYLDGYYKQAHQSINRLLQLNSDSEFLSLIYLKSARAHLKLAHWDEARKHLKKIINEFPDSLEVHVAKQLLSEKQYFAVQVGAFIDRKRAETLTDELKTKGEYAYIVETSDQQNRRFYRVRVGQLVLLEKAEKLKLKLSKDGYPTQIYP